MKEIKTKGENKMTVESYRCDKCGIPIEKDRIGIRVDDYYNDLCEDCQKSYEKYKAEEKKRSTEYFADWFRKLYCKKKEKTK